MAQLEALGLGARAVRKRAAVGRLYRVHQAVYSTTPPHLLPREARWLAAVLACGPGALLSHRSAAALHQIRAWGSARIDVTSPTGRGRKVQGIAAHRAANLAPQDRDEIDGIPCTALARTFLDLAVVLKGRPLERAVDQSDVMQTFDLRAVDDVLARNPTHAGVPNLQKVLDTLYREPQRFATLTESEFEEGFLELCRAAGFPPPEVQVPLTLPNGEEIRADFVWRRQRVIVETDGPKYHRTYFTRERNAERDLLLSTAGWRPVRLTPRMVFKTRAQTARTIGALLAGPESSISAA